MSEDALLVLFGVTGGVVIISAIASGILDRRGLSLVPFFLVFGIAVGPHGLNIADFGFNSALLRAGAMLSLTMVLFSDATTVRPAEVRRYAGLTALILGPGTLLAAAIISVAAWQLLDLSPVASAMLGAALASTDPVLLRPLLRSPRMPPRVKQALGLESGLNDAVLLPIVLIAITLATGESTSLTGWVERILLGPLIGALIGFVCAVLLQRVRGRYGMRHDYESIYAVGVALTAFVAAEAIHASGFLAAFAAGLAIAFRDLELCDCFHDYGEATAEITLLLTFVALGTSLIWTGLDLISVTGIIFVIIALAARPIAMLLVVRGQGLDAGERRLLAWFGPRGLSSLLLCLLPVFAGVPEGERVFAACSLVALVSIVLHGFSPAFMGFGETAEVKNESRDLPQAG